VTLSMDFRSRSENGRSCSGQRMERNAPTRSLLRVSQFASHEGEQPFTRAAACRFPHPPGPIAATQRSRNCRAAGSRRRRAMRGLIEAERRVHGYFAEHKPLNREFGHHHRDRAANRWACPRARPSEASQLHRRNGLYHDGRRRRQAAASLRQAHRVGRYVVL